MESRVPPIGGYLSSLQIFNLRDLLHVDLEMDKGITFITGRNRDLVKLAMRLVLGGTVEQQVLVGPHAPLAIIRITLKDMEWNAYLQDLSGSTLHIICAINREGEARYFVEKYHDLLEDYQVDGLQEIDFDAFQANLQYMHISADNPHLMMTDFGVKLSPEDRFFWFAEATGLNMHLENLEIILNGWHTEVMNMEIEVTQLEREMWKLEDQLRIHKIDKESVAQMRKCLRDLHFLGYPDDGHIALTTREAYRSIRRSVRAMKPHVRALRGELQWLRAQRKSRVKEIKAFYHWSNSEYRAYDLRLNRVVQNAKDKFSELFDGLSYRGEMHVDTIDQTMRVRLKDGADNSLVMFPCPSQSAYTSLALLMSAWSESYFPFHVIGDFGSLLDPVSWLLCWQRLLSTARASTDQFIFLVKGVPNIEAAKGLTVISID